MSIHTEKDLLQELRLLYLQLLHRHLFLVVQMQEKVYLRTGKMVFKSNRI